MSEQEQKLPQNTALAALGATELAPGHDEKHTLLMQTLSEAQVDFLMQRTPKREIKMRQGRGGLQFAYVEHGYVTERLNLVFGFNWDFEIVDKQILEDEVIVEARLTVRTPGGQTIVKTQFGGAEIKRHASGTRSGKPLSIADDYKAAASDALKKCASLLGIGLDLYGRDRPVDPSEDASQPASAPREATPTPQPEKANISELGDYRDGLCTPKQVSRINALARQARLDPAELSASLGVAEFSQLIEARAQRVIKRLEELASEAEQAS
jgi:hypothetical protein